MKLHHTKWAATHDWYLRTIELSVEENEQPNYMVVVRNDMPSTLTNRELHFESVTNLVDWAGY